MRREDIMASGRLAGEVLRYHTWPVHRRQSVAEHTWQVLRIYIAVFGPPQPQVTVFIVNHDRGELRTGDLPFPFKSLHPEIKDLLDIEEDKGIEQTGGTVVALTPDLRRCVKVADLIEMFEFGLNEWTMGNRYGLTVAHDCLVAAYTLAQRLAPEVKESVRTYLRRVLAAHPHFPDHQSLSVPQELQE